MAMTQHQSVVTNEHRMMKKVQKSVFQTICDQLFSLETTALSASTLAALTWISTVATVAAITTHNVFVTITLVGIVIGTSWRVHTTMILVSRIPNNRKRLTIRRFIILTRRTYVLAMLAPLVWAQVTAHGIMKHYGQKMRITNLQRRVVASLKPRLQ